MDNFLFSILGFVVALGVLITIHEFGHFWVARRFKVKVLRFSIGFGKPLWRYQKHPDDTEYVVAAIPLGGYVKMLDEREGEVPESLRDQAFNRQPLHARTAIVAAGPLFNFIFAVLAYWLMFVAGVPGVKPLVGDILPNSLAEQAGIEVGAEIVAIDGERTPTWGSASLAVVSKMLSQREVEIETAGEFGQTRSYRVELPEVSHEFGKQDGLVSLGIKPWAPHIPAVIGRLQPDGAAAKAGMQPGDQVVEADGEQMEDWNAWVEYVRAHPQQTIAVLVEREGATEQLLITPARVEHNGESFGQIGAAVDFQGELPEHLRAKQQYGFFPALVEAAAKTWDMSMLTLQVFGKMITGQVSLDNLSGPLTIAQYAGYSVQSGMTTFLSFLAIVSLSLGVLNLLPVPMLDGGHLLYYAIEFIKGSPLSEEAQFLGQRIGIVLLLMLMSLALYNDFARLFG